MIGSKASAWLRASLALLTLVLLPLETGAAILSTKRGFADVGANYSNLQATGAGWYYTWGTGIGNPGNFDAKHYPMFWNAPNQSTIDNVKARNSEYVLGFNEPERSDQANMTVSQAIASWTQISNSFAGTTTKLVSPAVSDTSTGQQWITSFMQQANANDLRVDAVAFHWYGVSNPNNPAGAASSFLSRVDWYHNTFQRPVFITEFAIHDWGNQYSDEAITEANRQFINIVIPALEARNYVAGYAWYHWFSDARLYEGNPSKPTPMAYNYVGAVGTGQVENIGGQNLGEHAAYLTGGELTMSGTPGTVRYINALANASSISGTLDWGMAGTNWVRVQPGATLRKRGFNTITWNAISVTNNGLIEVAEGVLRLSNNSTITGSGKLRVSAGGTLNLQGGRDASSVTISYPVELRAGTMSTDVANGFLAASGTMISGAGTIAGRLTALSGSVIQVGDDGVSVPRRLLIDNFESYATGNVRTVANPPWTAHGGGSGTQFANIENQSGNKVLTYGWWNGSRGTSRDMPAGGIIDGDQAGTFFFRFNSKTDQPDHSFGLADHVTTSSDANFNEYQAQFRIAPGTASGSFAVQARNGGAFTPNLATGLAPNTWYNVWMVVDQATDTYDVYMNTGTADATAVNKLNATPLAFRNGTSVSLNNILALAAPAPIDYGVRIDDLHFFHGVDLINPLAGFSAELFLDAATITVQGNFTLNSGATLKLDIFDPTTVDRLVVEGAFTAGGALSVTLVPGAPSPQAGDTFDLLDFTSSSGAFSTLALPSLAAGLAWNTSNLLTMGALEVVFAGDYNGDGMVDAADYVLWRKTNIHGLQGFEAWRANFGRVSGSGSSLQNWTAVPEPGPLLLVLLAAICAPIRARQLR